MIDGNPKTARPATLGILGLALSGLLGGSPGIHAQEPKGFSAIPVNLDPDSRNAFWIDSNQAITFLLPADRRDLRLVFKDPKGMVWEIAAPTAEAPQNSPQTLYGTTIEGPAAGVWTLSVAALSPFPGYPIATLRITYANHVRARMSLPRQTLVTGEALPVTLEVMDGITRVKNLQPRVTMTKLEDPGTLPTFVTFRDDGLQGDRIAKDGLYTTILPAEAPGRFHLEAQVEGLASTGHFHRSSTLSFKVVTKAARITGNIRQRILVGTPD